MALGMDQGQHHVRLQTGLAGFAVHQTQQRQALRRIRHVARETRRHVQQPDFGIETVLKAVRFGDGALQQITQFGLWRLTQVRRGWQCERQ